MELLGQHSRSLDETRAELERLASDLRKLADHADQGVQSLDHISHAEATVERWAPVALLIGSACVVLYAITRRRASLPG